MRKVDAAIALRLLPRGRRPVAPCSCFCTQPRTQAGRGHGRASWSGGHRARARLAMHRCAVASAQHRCADKPADKFKLAASSCTCDVSGVPSYPHGRNGSWRVQTVRPLKVSVKLCSDDVPTLQSFARGKLLACWVPFFLERGVPIHFCNFDGRYFPGTKRHCSREELRQDPYG